MTTPNRTRFAVELFLASMRQSWMADNAGSDKECPVKLFDDYDDRSRMALVKAIGAAIKTSLPAMDGRFRAFEDNLKRAEAAKEVI